MIQCPLFTPLESFIVSGGGGSHATEISIFLIGQEVLMNSMISRGSVSGQADSSVQMLMILVAWPCMGETWHWP